MYLYIWRAKTSMSDRLEENVLILRCRVGDRDALSELIRRYSRRLRYFISHLSDSPEMTEDIFQDTWVRVIGKMHTLRNIESFTTWLYRIARNTAFQQLRRKKMSCELHDNIVLPDEQPSDSFSPADAAKIHNGLKKLHPAHREILALRFLEQMSYQQVAEVLGCNLNTVKSRIYYAKLALKKEMEAKNGKRQ
jgi:RNA polymerase sigma-70 factor (ECF subfamily)